MNLKDMYCPLCSSIDVKIVSRRKKLQHIFCKKCRFSYTIFKDKKEADLCQMRFGDSTISNEWFTYGMFDFHDQRVKLANSTANLRYNYYSNLMGRTVQSILDVGCADGIFYNSYRELGVSWRGIEISEESVKFANSRGVPVEFQDFSNFETNSKYDVIFASQVLEHFLDPNLFMKKCKDLLNPSGILHIDIPNHDGIIGLLTRKMNPFVDDYGGLQPPYHLRAYNKFSLDFLMKKHNIQPKHIQSYANDHKLFGQISIISKKLSSQLMFRFSELFGMGSLLVGIGII